ncbi:hypothetical protein [Actinoplanes sp. NPDC026619]|uniref:hypothetical protein n=1 Tax=Actinoplanes sp. NPDC026619 TaxID=3155798 RepID=UPI0033C3CF3E
MAALANGAAAYAYWTSTGQGDAAGKAGSVITLSASAKPIDDALLYPGVQRNLRVTIKNNNSFPVLVTKVERGTDMATPDAAHATAGCVRTGVSIMSPTYPVAWRIEPKTSKNFSLGGAIGMSNDSDSACQSATFKLQIVVTGQAQSA